MISQMRVKISEDTRFYGDYSYFFEKNGNKVSYKSVYENPEFDYLDYTLLSLDVDGTANYKFQNKNVSIYDDCYDFENQVSQVKSGASIKKISSFNGFTEVDVLDYSGLDPYSVL